MWKTKFWAMALTVSLLLAFTWSCGSGEKVPLLDKETIESWLSDRELFILDVRAPKDWHVSDKKIKGAVRQDPDEVQTWAANLPKNKKIVLYCQKEGTIVRVARQLNDLGFKQVLALKGGWHEWEKAGYPTVPK
jgi:hydroxyacylglutathione hydrolase